MPTGTPSARPRGLLAFANAAFLLLFLLSFGLQVNDPDPARWMAIYGAGAAGCVAWGTGRRATAWCVTTSAAALVWAALWTAGLRLGVPLGQALTDWGMHAQGSEEAREIGGLLLVAGWMAVLAATAPRPRAVQGR